MSLVCTKLISTVLRKYYGCELVNLTGTVVKVELISIFTTAVFECWNVCDKYTWDNAGYLKQLPIDQTPISEDNRSDLRQISCHGRNYSQPYFFKRNQSSDNRSHGFGANFC